MTPALSQRPPLPGCVTALTQSWGFLTLSSKAPTTAPPCKDRLASSSLHHLPCITYLAPDQVPHYKHVKRGWLDASRPPNPSLPQRLHLASLLFQSRLLTGPSYPPPPPPPPTHSPTSYVKLPPQAGFYSNRPGPHILLSQHLFHTLESTLPPTSRPLYPQTPSQPV